MSRYPWLPAPINDALADLERRLTPEYVTIGPVLEVTVDAAPRAVAHGLRTVPSGFRIHLATGAVYAVTPERWTEDLAWITAPAAHTFVRLQFYLLATEAERV